MAGGERGWADMEMETIYSLRGREGRAVTDLALSVCFDDTGGLCCPNHCVIIDLPAPVCPVSPLLQFVLDLLTSALQVPLCLVH